MGDFTTLGSSARCLAKLVGAWLSRLATLGKPIANTGGRVWARDVDLDGRLICAALALGLICLRGLEIDRLDMSPRL